MGAVKLEGYLWKKVHFGFNVKQDDWIQWIGLSSQTVKYDPIYWKQAGYFFYPYRLLKSKGDAAKEFTGVFYVTDSESNKTLMVK